MVADKEKERMTIHDLAELLTLNGWSRMKLAIELEVTENTVHRWFMWGKCPRGPVSILLRDWLNDARRRAKKTKR